MTTNRKLETTKEEDTTTTDVIQTGKVSIPFGMSPQTLALTDTLIATHYTPQQQIIIFDLDAKSQQDGYNKHVVIEDAITCHVSRDNLWFIVLSHDKIRMWPLAWVRTVDDFKKVTAISRTLDIPLQENFNIKGMFTIGENSNLIVWYSLNYASSISIINLKNGKRKNLFISLELDEDIALCPLGENYMVIARGKKGLFAYEIIRRDQDVVLSEATRPIRLDAIDGVDYNDCTASTDGRFLGARCINARGDIFYLHWSVQPNLKTKLMGEFFIGHVIERLSDFKIFFTSNNTFVHQIENEINPANPDLSFTAPDYKETHYFAYGSNCTSLPNSDILLINSHGEFSILRTHCGSNREIYQQAFTEFVHAVEVANSGNFPGTIARLISSYSAGRLFSRPRTPLIPDAAPERAIFNSILSKLSQNPRLRSYDKAVLVSILKQEGSIRDCAEQAWSTAPKISSDLEEFLIDLQTVMAPLAIQVRKRKA